jgi:small-conductance mechanosensitive channel
MTMRRLTAWILGSVLAAAVAFPSVLLAADQAPQKEPAAQQHPEQEPPTAAVEIDGEALFRVRGVTAFPAEQRAARIASRIVAFAQDPEFRPEMLQAVEAEVSTDIVVGTRPLMRVVDADARIENVSRQTLARAFIERIGTAVEAYRKLRSREHLTNAALHTAAATAVMLAVIAALIWLFRRTRALLEQRFAARVQSIEIQSFQIMGAESIRGAARSGIGVLRALIVLVVLFYYLGYVLSQFPWTRATAKQLAEYVVGPLRTMGQGLVAQLPDIVFLVILFFVVRYVLKLVQLFFQALEAGRVTLASFDPDWAPSTYRLVRALIVVFALVVAYPYIPGSSSDAFKGISIFIGIVFSLGSSSAIANLIAGYMLTYRRAFRVGDRVRIGSFTGDVVEQRLQATHLRTVKNEEVIVPNSSILSSEVVNYSTLARAEGVILHTTVGIGYETPWRQVEAMLLEAARRTSGVKTEPQPFVRQQALGDFCVTYELNAYCGDAQMMGLLYTELRRHTLDVFNEYGIQIMTPAYEGDPAEPKIVPKDAWFTAPAKPDPGRDGVAK